MSITPTPGAMKAAAELFPHRHQMMLDEYATLIDRLAVEPAVQQLLARVTSEREEAKRIHADDLRAKDWEIYRHLKKGEVSRVGDSYYWEDTDKWLPVVAGGERAVSDPQFPAHVIFRRHMAGELARLLGESDALLSKATAERDAAVAERDALRARVAELEQKAERYRLTTLRQDATIAELATDGNAATLAANLAAVSQRNAELETQLEMQTTRCIEREERLAQAEACIADREQRNAELVAALEAFMESALELIGEPPERNCSCHLSPPCNDCVNHNFTREMLDNARAALARHRAAQEGKQP